MSLKTDWGFDWVADNLNYTVSIAEANLKNTRRLYPVINDISTQVNNNTINGQAHALQIANLQTQITAETNARQIFELNTSVKLQNHTADIIKLQTYCQ